MASPVMEFLNGILSQGSRHKLESSQTWLFGLVFYTQFSFLQDARLSFHVSRIFLYVFLKAE